MPRRQKAGRYRRVAWLKQHPAVLSRGLGRLAEQLANKSDLGDVTETPYDNDRDARMVHEMEVY